ncbi:hypothetical protein MF628_000684 [Paenibacillus polymyxa]|uniref:hypothetical protein n=1 Tax=Paenibacillus polymyxa TaxID=1406 RepID=UPI00202553FA|nr:hypothetical protein [Paenibacillus polymyxa]URJ46177.1 hypothetical protein MF628_000684 [Paenibacillus polymyxa]
MNEVNKVQFLQIYKGKMNVQFESDFQQSFNMSYKSFLADKYDAHNKDTKALSNELGISERDIIKHLKNYSIIDRMTLKQWGQYLIDSVFIMALKALIGVIGMIPIFYFIGYLILYAYFFGESGNPLLDIVIKNVPINTASCYITGFIFTGVITFFLSVFWLRKRGKMFITATILYFIFAFSLSLIVMLSTTDSTFGIIEILKICMLLLFPLLGAMFIVLWYYLTIFLSKYYKIFLILVVSLIIAATPIYLLKFNSWIMELIVYIIIVSSLVFIGIKIFLKNNANKQDTSSSSDLSKKETFSIKGFFAYIVMCVSLLLVIAPIFSVLIFWTGDYFGETFQTLGLNKNEVIQMGSTTIEGKLVTEKDDYLYISTASRELLKINKDQTIKVTNSKYTSYQGESDTWKVRLDLFAQDNKTWYKGEIKNKVDQSINSITYQLHDYNKISQSYSVPLKSFYIIGELNLSSSSIGSMDSIKVSGKNNKRLFKEETITLKKEY